MKRQKQRQSGKPSGRRVPASLPAVKTLSQIPDKSSGNSWFFGLLLVVAVIAAYQPSWRAGFIWDDDAHLTQNPCIVGPLGFKAIWTSSAAVYYPLVLSSFWIQHAIWGLLPLPYHLFNICMHAACAILLWRVLQNLRVPGAWLGAALWAFHPVQVESVAWITELKNTQSCLFYLLAILFFLKWHRDRMLSGSGNNGERFYALALICGVLAILSKSSTVMLPVVIGLACWWMEGRWNWRNIWRLAPFFLISALASVWTIWEQKFHSGALGSEWSQSWPEHFIIAARIIWFYLGKLVWPIPLIFIYPRWQVNPAQAAAYLPIVVTGIVLAAVWYYRNQRLRPVFFAFAYFLVSLFPVLGFFNVYFFRYSFVGDHFQYLASMGPLALAGAAIHLAVAKLPTAKKPAELFAGGILLLALGGLTWRHARDFADDETLWRTTLRDNPICWMAHNNLGNDLMAKGHREEAVRHFERALEINSNYDEAHNNLGAAYMDAGQMDKALAEYNKALEINPRYVEAINNLGGYYLRAGRFDEAVKQFNLSLRIRPGFVKARAGLGIADLQEGRIEDAIKQLREALEIQPDLAEARNTLGTAYLRAGQLENAAREYRRAAESHPEFPQLYNNLGMVLMQEGRIPDAIVEYQSALKIMPNYAEARVNLGLAYSQTGRAEDAIGEYRKVLATQPDNVDALNNLAWALAMGAPDVAHADESVGLASRANQLTAGNNPQILRTLAAAYAKAKRNSEAVETARRASQLADAQGNKSLAEVLQGEIKLYDAAAAH